MLVLATNSWVRGVLRVCVEQAAACVCSNPAAEFGRGTGTITYVDPLGKATSTIGFPPRCQPYPRETVLRDKNPTCDIRTYVGGLSTCHHGWHLLDADQEVPWQDQPLECVHSITPSCYSPQLQQQSRIIAAWQWHH